MATGTKRSLLLTSETFDRGEITAATGTAEGSSVLNLQDSQPRVRWVIDGATASFVADLRDADGNDPELDAFVFAASKIDPSPDPHTTNLWRVRVGPTDGTWSTYDSGTMPMWPLPSDVEPAHLSHTRPSFYREGVGFAHVLDDLLAPTRFVRIDFTELTGEPRFGRFLCGRSVRPLALRGSAASIPTGPNGKTGMTWDLALLKDDYTSVLYRVLERTGTAPVLLESYGGDLWVTGGRPTAVVIKDILEPVPWELSQEIVYGVISAATEPTVISPTYFKSSLTMRGL